MKNNTVIAFDLDDTLYKERDYVIAAYRTIIERYGSEMCDADRALFMSYSKPYEAFEFFCSKVPGSDIENLKTIYRSGSVPIKDTEGAEDLLRYLKSQGYATAVITDGFSARQRAKLHTLGIDSLIDTVIISEETGFDKHTPKPFELLEKLYPDADVFYYIGDNPEKDFYYPNISGWHTIMISDTNNHNIHTQHTLQKPAYNAKTTLMSLAELKKHL